MNYKPYMLLSGRTVQGNVPQFSRMPSELGTHLYALSHVWGRKITNNTARAVESLFASLVNQSFFPKIRFLNVMLGGEEVAFRCVPLVNNLYWPSTLTVGWSVAGSWSVDGTTESLGLQSPASGVWTGVDFGQVRPANLGLGGSLNVASSDNNGGYIWWETNINNAGATVEPIGCYNGASSERYVLDLRGTLRAFRWGTSGGWASQSAAATNGCYHGQSNNGTQQLFLNGSLIATGTPGGSTLSGINDNNIYMFGNNAGGSNPYLSRCACAGLTNGLFTATEVATFYDMMIEKFFKPLKRPYA